jgi:TldD protein
MRKIIFFVTIFFVTFNIYASDDIIISSAEKEIKRTMSALSDNEIPPYYISYQIFDLQENKIESSFGKTMTNIYNERRLMDMEIRVGDYEFDNTHIIRGNPFMFSSAGGSVELPLTNDEQAIRNAIWFVTDSKYKDAVEKYSQAKTNNMVKVEMEDTSADFSKEEPNIYVGEEINFKLDNDKWQTKLNELTEKFNDYDWIYDGKMILTTQIIDKYLVNSEGTRLKWSESYCRLYVIAKTKAEDGTSLPIYESYFAFEPDGLPESDEIASDIENIIIQLDELKNAETLSRYSGPALLTGEAAGVFFHEIFGHRVEGFREKDPNSSQMFKEAINEKILPEYVDIIFDPTIKNLYGNNLAGYYKYDDQGVQGKKVETVKNGIFKGFLMSRHPIEGFSNSNGHGRKQIGYPAVTRQSNLIVKANKTKSREEMRKMLLEQVKEQGLEYGLLFDKVQEGFTLTGRSLPNSYNVHPVIIYKIYADGRDDEMVRGVNLIGTPMTTFSNILAMGDDTDTFNGMCGAESGSVPVSASSPSVLISYIEVQKKDKSQAKPPILSAPDFDEKISN